MDIFGIVIRSGVRGVVFCYVREAVNDNYNIFIDICITVACVIKSY